MDIGRRLRSASWLALLLVTATTTIADTTAPKSGALPSREQLDQARVWLWANPPDGTNAVQRRERMGVIQTAADQLTPETYWQYERAWQENPKKADEMQDGGVLYYLSTAIDNALRSIHDTQVKHGLVVWHIYNMGYVFKTPKACFGIDLQLRHAERLARDLDFLLITHEHNDHYSKELVDAMISMGKPVVTRRYRRSTIVNAATELRFDSVRVKVDIGDHHREAANQRNNMLMFQVDCGESADNCTVYHSGGGNNYEKMRPDESPDIFIVHVQVGMDIAEAMRELEPRRTFVSHLLELGHSPLPPHAWRWSFDYAFDRVEDFPEEEAIVLTWGERWLYPDTVLANREER